MREIVSRLWIFLHLLYLSAEDIKEQQISMPVILVLGGSGLLHAIAVGHIPSVLPGCAVLLVGFLSRERIGYGDGWLMLALGMWADTAELLFLFWGGIMLGSLHAFFFQRKEFPLVPFLTAVYIMKEWL